MDWNPNKIDLGTLRVGQTTQLKFIYTGANPELIQEDRIQVGCHCTKAKWDANTRELILSYHPNPIPPQLKLRGQHHYDSEKYVLVNYVGKIDKLIFTAHIRE